MHSCAFEITQDTLKPIEELPERYEFIHFINQGKEKYVYKVYDSFLEQNLAMCVLNYNDLSTIVIKSSQFLKMNNINNVSFSHPIDYAVFKKLPNFIEEISVYDEECYTGLYFAFTMELLDPLSNKILPEFDKMREEALLNYDNANKLGWRHTDWDPSNVMIKKSGGSRIYKDQVFDTEYYFVFIDYSEYNDKWGIDFWQSNFDKDCLIDNFCEIIKDLERGLYC